MRGYLVERDGLPRAWFADEAEARAYAAAHAARVAHSAREPHDEKWLSEREALNDAVGDALASLRA